MILAQTPGINCMTRLLACALILLLVGCTVSQEKLTHEQIAAVTSPIEAGRETIALLGATGMAGGHILREALARGYKVRALTRDPAKLAYLRHRIEIVPGDALNADSIRTLLAGSDVVISALGPVKADGAAGIGLTTTASAHIVEAMQVEGIRQYILLSGAGVVMPGDQRNATGWWVRQLARWRYPSLLKERQAEYELLTKSAVQWTVVRCPVIDSSGFRQAATVSLRTPESFTLRAGELAAFILDQVDTEKFARKGPFLGSE